ANPIYINSCRNWSISHNTINRDATNTNVDTTHAAIRIGGITTYITIKNNIISISKTGAALPLYIVANSNIDSMDRNVVYRADISNNKVMHMGGSYYLLSNYKGAGGFNTNSVFLRPSFKNDTNL